MLLIVPAITPFKEGGEWNNLKRFRYCFQAFLEMVTTPSGLAGLIVTSHVMGELRFGFVHAPIPRLRTVEMTAADWDELQKCKYVT